MGKMKKLLLEFDEQCIQDNLRTKEDEVDANYARTNLRLAIEEVGESCAPSNDHPAPIPEKQKPVAWHGVTGDYGFPFLSFQEQPGMTPLYTHPAHTVPEGWQPIETAPKDGTTILACLLYRDGCNGGIETVRWHSAWGQWVLSGCLIGLQNNSNDADNLDPICWMPLPAAPKL